MAATPALMNTEGEGEGRNKRAGYLIVIDSPGVVAPPADGANTSVADAFVFAAKRSDSGTVNDANDTLSPMLPVEHVSTPSRSGSREVVTYIPVALSALALPVTKPVNVTVTDTPATICPLPDVVITTDVDEGCAAVPATFNELMATPGAGQPSAKK